MKLIILIMSILSPIILFGQEFGILEATSQKWAGGRKESGHGINYHVKMIANKGSNKLSIEKLWIGTDFYDVNVQNIKIGAVDHSFIKNDTICITVRYTTGKEIDPESGNPLNQNDNKQVKTEKAPIDFKGAALIGYKYKGKWKYKTIDAFKELERVNYP